MPLPTIYSTGTVTVANGGTTVTGVGTAWLGSIYAGDLFTDPAQGIFARVTADATSNTSLSINAWPGTGMTGDAYEILITADTVRMQERTRQVLNALGEVTNTGIGIDAFGLFADRDTHDAEIAGFAYLSTDGDGGSVTDPVVFIKNTATSADWSAAIAITGVTGDPGENVAWLVGAGAPSGGLGADGDVYLNTTNGDVYGPKASGAWGSVAGNIKGTTGDTGADGTDPGILLTWDVANGDSDPGTGKIRADNDALGSAAWLYVDKANRAGSDIAAFLLALDDSTTTAKGTLTLTDTATEAQAGWTVTGVTDATGYVKVAVSGHFGATGFADTLPVSLQFSRAGDKGADGAGAVDSVNGQTGVIVLDADDLDDTSTTNKFATAAQLAKVDHLTVTQAVDLDAIETAVGTALQPAAIGVSVQAYDADLTTWAGLTPSANAQSLVTAADYAAMRTLLGLVIGTNVQAYDADLASWAGVTRASGFDTFAATPSSANLKSLVTDETGSGGALVFATSPTISGPTFTRAKIETVYTITDGAAFAVDPTNGEIQFVTLGASRTPVPANWTAGQSVTLRIADGTAYAITWSGFPIVWKGGSAPTLATTGYTEINIEYSGGVYRGVHVGDFAS